MKILFKIYPQKSHINATFPLARLLREAGHEIVYAGLEVYRSYIESQGNAFHVQATDIFPVMDPKKGAPKLTLGGILRRAPAGRKHSEVLKKKYASCTAFDGLVREIKPDLVLVDSPYTFFSLSLVKHGIPFAILESIGNLNRSGPFPPMDTDYVPAMNWLGEVKTRIHWTRYFLKRWLLSKAGMRIDFDSSYVFETARNGGVSPAAISFNRYFHIGLREIPEIILSPADFDFPRKLAPNQYNIGPCVEMNRVESSSDYRFSSLFSKFKREREDGIPLVYCSLGTASWRYQGLESFLGELLKAAQKASWNLILAVGTEFDTTTLGELPRNVACFQVVPQLEVLRHVDLMITHGGMNSITECIMSAVPMVVFPGTMQIDQGGNAARVTFHQIGLKGRMDGDSAQMIRRKIGEVLNNPIYKTNVQQMRARIEASDAHSKKLEIFFAAMEKHFPALKSRRETLVRC